MFKIDNEFKNANVSRTIRFTEPLFELLNETASKMIFLLICLFCNVVNMLLTTKIRQKNKNKP